MDIGASLTRKCNFDVSKLIKPKEYPRNANVFYEMFLEDYNGDLIDVPVLIRNHKHENQLDNLEDDKRRWKLVRRFFIYDTVSGISQTTGGTYAEGSPPAIVRFAQSVKIKIDLDPNGKERIFPPYLEITYKVVEAKEIDMNKNRLQTVEFAAEYNDSNDFEELRTVTFIVLMCIMGLMILFHFWKVQADDKVAGGQVELTQSLNRAVTFGLSLYSTIFFWYLVAMTGAWFLFFKLQERVYCFMPALDRKDVYKYYDDMLISLIVLKIFSVMVKIFEQSTFRTFLVDWEPTRWYHESSAAAGGGGPTRAKQAVSPWRRLFIANELNELQA